MAAMSDWRSFWDSNHSIYVNARHKDVHYREVAEGIAGETLIITPPNSCGRTFTGCAKSWNPSTCPAAC